MSHEGAPAGHGHGGGGGHDHGVSRDADRRYLSLALALLVTYLVLEVVVAVLSGSLALLSDAAHMLTDAAAIALALVALTLAGRPAQGRWTFGLQRSEILSGLLNGVTLLVLGAVLAVEAVRRLLDPPPVAGGPVLAVALAGVVVNLVAAWLIAKANRTSLNVEGAYRHIVTDLYGFIGTAVAAVVILLTGWTRADAIASLVVVALMLHAGWALVRQAGEILLEAAPVGTDLDGIRAHLLELDHVVDVHDLHVWTVTSSLPALSAHVVVEDGCYRDGHAPQLLDRALECLAGHFDVEHSTLQLEPAEHLAHEVLGRH
ncbi:cation diffusion facilitator family transporter [Lapillicoccus jejuensis]|uniref:Cobalt-zinc-cadmium efflux system protein n=1 Tax=Lapillicoccus jejuensis TaxID=402171 RepID=A0A542E2D4_9MICO|nr:cation diffusion facilitator family transporter [Lapillicoccus jejuensis]TQJ09502.1 cobalt-zinc-cadmium efflux system protein [Lapillicoccus jejuensis]